MLQQSKVSGKKIKIKSYSRLKILIIPSNSVLWFGILSKVGGKINIGIEDGVITRGSLAVHDLALLYNLDINITKSHMFKIYNKQNKIKLKV